MAAVLKPMRQLAGGSGLARTLQAGHEHDGRRLRGKLNSRRVFAKNFDQLIANDFDDLLARRKRGSYLLPYRLRLHLIDELFYDFEIDVSLEQGKAQLTQGLLYVLVVENCLPA